MLNGAESIFAGNLLNVLGDTRFVEELLFIEAAGFIGKLVAERAAKTGVSEVVFDRGGFLYTGKVKALADAAREAGLQF